MRPVTRRVGVIRNGNGKSVAAGGSNGGVDAEIRGASCYEEIGDRIEFEDAFELGFQKGIASRFFDNRVAGLTLQFAEQLPVRASLRKALAAIRVLDENDWPGAAYTSGEPIDAQNRSFSIPPRRGA